MPSWLVILLIVLVSLVGLFLVLFISNGIIFTNISFRRRKGDANFAKNEDPRAKKDIDRIWYFSQSINELEITSYDNLKLKGYFLNNNSNKLAILVHGYHGRYYSTVSQARIFYELGYDVLSINNRTHDTSEGKLISMGKKESLDLERWIETMLKQNPKYQIVLYGISMGAHIVMQTAAKNNVNEKVKCVIEDCGYNSLKKELIYVVKKSPWPFPRYSVFMGELYSILIHHFSYSNDISKVFKNLKLPILMFHGGKDETVPLENVYKINEAVPEGVYKEMHVFDDAKHTKCVATHKEEYREIVTNFVNKFVK